MGGHHDPKNGHFIGVWGDLGCPTPQRIATYSLSSNRQRPFAGALNAAIFNSWRRFRSQVLYVAPPFIAAYAIMNWAEDYNHFLNSKAGRALAVQEEE